MKSQLIFITIVALLLSACSGGGTGQQSGPVELTRQVTAAGAVSQVGEVDWYHFRAVEANNVLQIRCSSNTYRSDVELLVTAFERDSNGNLVRLYGDHAKQDSQLPADLKMNLYIDQPKDIYISVRDLMDDEASSNSYYLIVDYAGQVDGDDNFTTAITLLVDDSSLPAEGNIGYIGDVDCYSFSAPTSGVYAVDVSFSAFVGGTDVVLKINLYDSAGNLIQTSSGGQASLYRLLPYLPAGNYFVLIEDSGRDDFDQASNYQIAVQTMAADETVSNDVQTQAAPMNYDAGLQAYLADGALAYASDHDWYQLPLSGLPSSGLQVLEISFADTGGSTAFRYRLEITDADGAVLLTHDYLAGSSPYQTEILSGNGDHFLRVEAADGQAISSAKSYQLIVAVLDVDDPAETGTGNDSIDTATPLATSSTPGSGWETGKVAYRGDVDWYSLSTDNSQPRILEMFFETEQASLADYAVSIMRDGLIKKVYDSTGADGPTLLKTSLYLPAGSPSGAVSYFYKVADTQGDEGDGLVPYWIRGNLFDIPAVLPVDGSITSAEYFSETIERSSTNATQARLEHNSMLQSQFQADTNLLNFNGPSPSAGISRSTQNGLTTISFPWIGGYIDYQGDQDWYELDLEPLYQDGVAPDTSWYYEILVEMHVGGTGSDVEYVWKFYRDANHNQILVDQANDSNGFFASDGDLDTVVQPFDITTPATTGTDQFWVGDGWAGRFYFSVSDFNYIASEQPDDDWGYQGAPYYFRLTLIYHPGVSQP